MAKGLNYIIVENMMKNGKGFMPRTVTSKKYNRKSFIERMSSRGAYRLSQYEGLMREFEETVFDILSDGQTVVLDDFIKITPVVKGRFDKETESYNKNKHTVEVEVKAAKKFSERVKNSVTVERVKPKTNGPQISKISTRDGQGRFSLHYPNTISGSLLKTSAYELKMVVLEKGSGDRNGYVELTIDDIYIISQKKSRLMFSFNHDFVMPEKLQGESEFYLKLVYNNVKSGKMVTTCSIYVRLV